MGLNRYKWEAGFGLIDWSTNTAVDVCQMDFKAQGSISTLFSNMTKVSSVTILREKKILDGSFHICGVGTLRGRWRISSSHSSSSSQSRVTWYWNKIHYSASGCRTLTSMFYNLFEALDFSGSVASPTPLFILLVPLWGGQKQQASSFWTLEIFRLLELTITLCRKILRCVHLRPHLMSYMFTLRAPTPLKQCLKATIFSTKMPWISHLLFISFPS